MRFALPISVLTLVAALGCGGAWNKAQAAAWAELTVEAEVFPDDANRKKLMDLLDEGYVRTATNEIGLGELAKFRPKLDAARDDGLLEPAELAAMEALAATWAGTGQAPDRASMIADKRAEEVEDRKRAAKRQKRAAEEVARAFAKWEMPEDLRDRLKAAGVDVKSCDSDLYDDLRNTRCEGAVGDDWVVVSVEEMERSRDARETVEEFEDLAAAATRDGNTVMSVEFSSQAKSKALAEACLAQGDHALSTRDLKSGAAQAGYSKRTAECDEDTEDGDTYLYCSFEKKGSLASVSYRQRRGAREGGEQVAEWDDGEWEVDARSFDLDAMVYEADGADGILAALFPK